MKDLTAFQEHAIDYDAWFDQNAEVYTLEIEILRRALPALSAEERARSFWLEVGSGSGRFTLPLTRCHCPIENKAEAGQ